MEKIEIQYSTHVEVFLVDLVEILFKKDYFAYVDSALAYVDRIIYQIENELPYKKHYVTSHPLKKYGAFYTKLKGAKRTTWYVFFNKKGHRLLITYISNNHVATAIFINDL